MNNSNYPRFLIVFVAVFFGAFLVGFLGCGAGSKACSVLDTVNDLNVCNVIRFVDQDGKVHEVPISKEDLKKLGSMKLAAQKAAASAAASASAAPSASPSGSAKK